MSVSIITRLLDPEPLTDEELEAQMEWAKREDGRTFINFHHPFYVGLHQDEFPEGASEDLREALDTRLKIRIKHEYLHDKGRTPSQMMIMFERAYRPTAAYVLIRRGLFRDDPHGLAEFIIDLWTDTEFPNRNDMWDRLWRAFPLIDEPLGDTELLDPSGITTVYRGLAVSDEDDVDMHHVGQSWTTERKTAEWFAHRFAGLEGQEIPVVLTGQVGNQNVLFCYAGRNESEVVSDAVTVTKVEFPQRASA